VHVLALAAQLKLTETQQRDVAAIFERMSAASKPLGGELIAQEQALSLPKAKLPLIASPWRRRRLASCKAGCGRYIWWRISKPALC
jgi:hypothetical protein